MTGIHQQATHPGMFYIVRQKTHFISSGLLPNSRKLYTNHNWFPYKRERRSCFPKTGLKHKNAAFLLSLPWEKGRGSSPKLHTLFLPSQLGHWGEAHPSPTAIPPSTPPRPNLCTSLEHQAHFGWISRHSSHEVALPLVHMLRPSKKDKDAAISFQP